MNDRSPVSTPASTPEVAAPARAFVDADGVRWRVTEQPFADYDRRSGTSLIFASDAAVRRVRNFPADWSTLADEELARLSWKS